MKDHDIPSEYDSKPWDTDTYQTGCTQPPKSHGGLIAVLLVAVIFLGGIASILGLVNIRLFRAIQEQPKQNNDSVVSFRNTLEPETTGQESAAPGNTEATEPLQSATAPAASSPVLDLQASPDSVPNISQEGGLSLQQIYVKAIPSVVSITCTQESGSSSGTGVIFSAEGYIVTNCHVVDGAVSVQVQLTDGRVFGATIVGTDATSDLAVLYIQADNLTPAEFGDSSVLQVGDAVVAIGDPLGVELRGTMTNGIVSAINRDITTKGRTMTLIQTNAALNAGNSGGPLLNCYGQVIGINTMKIGDYMSSAGVEGLGFAIPSTTVKEIVDQLVAQGYVSGRPTLGLTGESVSEFYQRFYRIPQGLFLTEVDETSDAAAKGIQAGDILLRMDGTRITDSDTYLALLNACQIGDTVQVIIYRGGSQYALELTVTEANG